MRSWTGRRGARHLTTGLIVTLVATAAAWAAPAPSFAQPARPAAAAAAAPKVTALGGVLEGFYSNDLVWSDGLNVRRPIASITKVMTALVVLRAGNLGRQITVTPSAVGWARRNDASSAGLVAGDVLTAQQLLEGMLLPSGADAAYMLAAAYGPGGTAFIAKMNATAAALGMRSTHFASFDGLPLPTETSTYSTPADLLKLGQAAMRIPLFRQIVDQRGIVLPAGDGHRRYQWTQTNKLIGSYAGAIGIKTGYTHGAGTCLLFEATRNGRTLIGVVLHTSTTYNPPGAVTAAERLLNWAFAQS